MRYLIGMLLIVSMLNCNQSQKDSAASNGKDSTEIKASIKRIKLDSTTIQISSHNKFDFFYFQDYFGEGSVHYELSKLNGSTTFRFFFDRDVKLFLVALDGKPNTKTVMIHPGESIEISDTISNGNIFVVNNNAVRSNELNLIHSMNKQIGTDLEGFYQYTPRVNYSTKQIIDSANLLYEKRLAFLNDYKRKYPISKENHAQLAATLNYIKYDNIVSLYAEGFKPLDKEIINFINDNPVYDEVNGKADERAWNYAYYIARNHMRNKSLSPVSMFDEASQVFKNKTRDRVLFQIVAKAFREGDDSLGNLLKRYSNISTDQPLKDYAEENFQLERFDSETTYQQASLIGTDNKEITWAELLDKNKGKVVYMDFWASWCAPCIAEMPGSHQLKESYDGKSVAFVYVSTDDLHRAWIKSAARNGLKNENSFRLKGGNYSKIKDTFKINAIPRYMIFDKNGNLKISSAPRPREKKTREYLDRLL
ncbi:TlpA disulfide reductase family protein [Dyadobacter sp. CY326]|uniref:TlpA family protein disulfide reductase n=1 Tax=Dyadobacter sp. CY326 TaxID=2907300 RepID=UPI001F1C6990|nr:TlpA disulfide reductase family protein [Dyadobacter sp. CY326]MCE7065165.1 TlpA family protein disulfide reductase [Dyadobacter sp. CY326]